MIIEKKKLLYLNLSHSWFRLLLLAIFAVGIFLRFGNIQERGLFYYDEGVYLSEARFVKEGIGLLLHDRSVILQPHFGFDSLKSVTQGIPLIMGKPGYILILYLFSLLFGVGDSLLFISSAVFGLINLILIFHITAELYNRNIALLAMAIAAVSSYHVFYSTTGFPEMIGLTFFLSGFWLYCRSTKTRYFYRYILLSGIAIGYAFTCNQWRWAILPLFIIAFEFVRMVRKEITAKRFIAKVSLFSGAFLIPVFFFQLPYTILSRFKGSLPFRSYFQQLVNRWVQGQGMGLSLKDNAVFLKYLWNVEGPLFTIALVGGFIVLAIQVMKEKRDEDIFLFMLALAPLALFSIFMYGDYVLSRMISIIVPFSAIVIARSFIRIQKPPLVCLLAGVILVAGFMHSAPLMQASTGYRQAAKYVKDKGYEKLFILDNEPVFRVYAGRIAYLPYQRPRSADELLRVSTASGVDKVVVDFNVLYSKYGMDYAGALTKTLQPEASFPNPYSGMFVRLTELYPFETIKMILSDPRCRMIDIYRLNDAGRDRKQSG